MRTLRAIFVVALLACALPVLVASQPARPAVNAVSDDGIPVTDEETRRTCGTCHTTDARNRMTRISDRRASPENWELTLRRMMSLNNVRLSPDMARRILKYLSDHHGLAPEEARPGMFDAERRMIEYTYDADAEVHRLCSTCHSMGRVLNERRTRDEWAGLLAMHRYYYPLIDGSSGGFRRSGGGSGSAPSRRTRGPVQRQEGGGEGGNRDDRHPFERAQDHLANAFPLMSESWTTWSAAMRTPRLDGRWTLTGHQLGKGRVFGEILISSRSDAPDAFSTEGRITYARTGESVARSGRALVYTGFQWRGRSSDAADAPGPWREVMVVDRGGMEMSGRWFTGAHDETGIDVTLRRVSSDPVIAGTGEAALRAASSGQRVRIFGANLPATAAAADVEFGQGVRVVRVLSATPQVLTVEIDVAPDARLGPRDVSVAGATRSAPLVVYSRIDAIKVIPRAGMARLGGAAFAPRLEQFEARGISYGVDGRPATADDLDLGPVEARWSLEEYTATFKDDDVPFVGELSQTGLFTPSIDGPNPKRSGNRNNIGDVWVVAALTPEGEDVARPLRGRAHLLVTVPIYIDWAPKQVGQ